MFANDSVRHVYLALAATVFFALMYFIMIAILHQTDETIKTLLVASAGAFLAMLQKQPQASIANSEKTTVLSQEALQSKGD
jgi:uncharacterized lipoprotein YajG